jgi:hypothetical protein
MRGEELGTDFNWCISARAKGLLTNNAWPLAYVTAFVTPESDSITRVAEYWFLS